MDLTQYVENLRGELAVAAAPGGQDARELAERLTAPLDAAVRLMLLDALSAAADEITRELAPGSVELRLRSGEPAFVVTPAPADEAAEPAWEPAAPAPPDADEGATARINLRLPEQLKAGIEHDPDEAIGLDGALLEIAQQSYGAVLLGAVALGLFVFGFYSLIEARYRKL